MKKKFFTEGKLAIVLVAFCLLAMLFGSYAWLYSSRHVYTFSHVAPPSTLAIKGPNQTTVEEIDLSAVDLKDQQHKVSFVFCVTGTETSQYQMELAHTTNVPFTYTIRPTSQHMTAIEDSLTCTVDGTDYYYSTRENALTGTYLNWDESTKTAVTGSGANNRHADVYGTYDSVEAHAEPVFCLFTGRTPGNTTGDFADYYILELTWDDDIAARYAKETDLVYLLAANETE